jgi:lysozyme
MILTSNTVSLIKEFEKLSLNPYPDYKQYSIGYGTYAGPYPGPKPALRLTSEAQAHDLLLDAIKEREAQIKQRLKVTLNPNQYGALLSFVYNVGIGNAVNVISDLNKGSIASALSRMKKTVYAGGEKLDGLVDRREKEVALFNAPVGGSLIPGGVDEKKNQNRKLILSTVVIIAVTVILLKWNF